MSWEYASCMAQDWPHIPLQQGSAFTYLYCTNHKHPCVLRPSPFVDDSVVFFGFRVPSAVPHHCRSAGRKVV